MPARNDKNSTRKSKSVAKLEGKIKPIPKDKPAAKSKPAKKPETPVFVVRRDDPKPDFDGTNLWFRNIRMVRLDERVAQKIALLDAFQKAKWPPRIAWPPHVNGNAVRMRARVRKLVSKLNARLEHPDLLFHADKNGVGWEAKGPLAA